MTSPRIERHSPVVWPHEARLAISLVVNVEEGAEYSVAAGDSRAEAVDELGIHMAPGQRNRGNESNYAYGINAGFWRLLNLFTYSQIPVTYTCAAVALEKHPDLARAITAHGHEPCAHGYRWITQYRMPCDQEREFIQAALNSIQRTTGERPYGWLSRYNPSDNTRLLLREAGFLYDCDAYDDDLPYYTQVAGHSWLVVPYALDTNDMKFWGSAPGFVTSEDYFQYLKSTFDVLYAEGETHPKMMSVGLHLRIIGRPGRFQALERFLSYATRHPGVWFARRLDIARWWHTQYPPTTDHGAQA